MEHVHDIFETDSLILLFMKTNMLCEDFSSAGGTFRRLLCILLRVE